MSGTAAAYRSRFTTLAVTMLLGGILPTDALGALQAATGDYEEVSVTDGGTLNGRVTFEGTAPKPSALLITRDFEVCGLGSRERREVDVSETGGLRAVVVFVEGVRRGKPWPETAEGYGVDQLECYFEPYIQVVRRGAELKIDNSDPILHNVHGYELWDETRRRTLFNLAQPDTGVVTRPLRPRRSQRVGLECDAHDFMLGWIFAADNPYAVVVDDEGRFSISELPPGTYTVGAWHPFLGVREREVTITADGTEELDLRFVGPEAGGGTDERADAARSPD